MFRRLKLGEEEQHSALTTVFEKKRGALVRAQLNDMYSGKLLLCPLHHVLKITNQTSFHECLVRSFPYMLKAPTEFGTVEGKNIINFLISDIGDGACQACLIDNVVRYIIMSHSKLRSLLRRFLTDYKWIRKKAEWRSLLSMVADYALVLNTSAEFSKDEPSGDSGVEKGGYPVKF